MRPKRSGKGARYCKAHQRVADQREKARKKQAARLASYYKHKVTKHDGKEHMERELEDYGREVRATLKAFGVWKV